MISEENFIMNCLKIYDNPAIKTIEEFEEDVAKFLQLTRMCSKEEMDFNKSNILLNHIVTLLNVFEPEVCIQMMFFKVKRENWDRLKTVLVFLNRMPNNVNGIPESEIKLCQKLIDNLRTI